MDCTTGFLYGTKIYSILDFSSNNCFNTLDIILWWSYGLMFFIFYKTVIKKVIKKS